MKAEIPEWSRREAASNPSGMMFAGSCKGLCNTVGWARTRADPFPSAASPRARLRARISVDPGDLGGCRGFGRALTMPPPLCQGRPNALERDMAPRGKQRQGTRPRAGSALLALTVRRSAAGSRRSLSARARQLIGRRRPGCTVTCWRRRQKRAHKPQRKHKANKPCMFMGHSEMRTNR